MATHCEECGDEFTETGPAAQSLACPGTCVWCYIDGADEDEDGEECHTSSDGCIIPGPRGPDCGCQSCRCEVWDASP